MSPTAVQRKHSILGIESSCDETAAAVVDADMVVRSSVVASQHDLHAEYGGVVPEIASRAHLERILPVVRKALDEAGISPGELAAVAAGVRPGLIGSLLVGSSAAKGLAFGSMLPFYGVDHVAAHLFAGLLRDSPEQARAECAYPALGLVVSGGHTSLFRIDSPGVCQLIGRTIDDAVGEAFDKAAVMLGLGHPGGPNLERCARGGDPAALAFPLPRLENPRDFSLSGLKTRLLYEIRGVPKGRGASASFARDAGELTEGRRRDLAASFQRAAIAQVVDRLDAALELFAPRTLLLGGGVVSNDSMRAAASAWCARRGCALVMPAQPYCVDNAAMIAGFAQLRRAAGEKGDALSTPTEPVSMLARGASPRRVQ